MPDPATVIAIYRVQAGKEDDFLQAIGRHYPTLKKLGLVTDVPPVVYRSDEGGPVFYEIFTWKEAGAADRAHELPEVMAVWEPMGALTEDRNGRPGMEFPHVRRVDLPVAGA